MPKPKTIALKVPIDWELIEKDWRAGIKTKLQMSQEYAVSRAAMDKHFDKRGITRDLKEKIRLKAEAMVAQQAVTKEVTQKRIVTTENEIITVNASILAAASNRHRTGLTKAWGIVEMLMDELKHQNEYKELYEDLGELMLNPDDKGRDVLNDVYRKAMTLPSRSGTAKTLMDALKTAITLEREILNISDAPSDNPLADFIKRISGSAFRPVDMDGECREVFEDAQAIGLGGN
jgi:hypothetical protein